jgi:hypothetical protein
MEKADAAFNDIEEKQGRIVAVLGGHGDVEVQAHCKPDGVVCLKAVAISGSGWFACPESGTILSVARRRGTRVTSLID